ncbi:ATP-dependent helicase [Mobiluncus porci]|uniref:ATP-dependent DNA helicase UvrD1 n=1 Tax=Mobiluncus porci TaxID=2652278 RepID=A0A7K0K1P0_9ACTO|nr:UvrD-helicase domain-containing protein [Mobiluncus porci]MST49344.1 AAA family ATPase [Mobiluncus porci]
MNDLFSSLSLAGGGSKGVPVSAALPGASVDAVPTSDYAPGSEGSREAWREEKIAAITRGLNPDQFDAVTHPEGPLLVMAGAGSGKTRVLTRRIAWLLATDRVRPWEVLAITFTNKAAGEMRERVERLVGNAAKYMWVSTFHSSCVRILRAEAEALGITRSFSIYDTADSKALLTRIIKGRGLDPKRFTPKGFAARISNAKNELIGPAAFAETAAPDKMSQLTAEIYAEYQQMLRRANAFDFDDLIAEVVYLWRRRPEILAKYREKFRHVLVDEYQDTNPAQYELVRLLALPRFGDPRLDEALDAFPGAELTVVGDSDQSIYAFRGATIRNIEEFESDFPGATTVYLEQNYRSTGTILSLANAIISENPGRHKKNLWTEAGDGAKAVLFAADSDRDEAAFIVREMRDLHAAGTGWDEFAVFYRTNSQSRSLEEMLTMEGIPYRVVGGTKFYDRKEVKDAIAYLTAAANPADDGNLLRIFNEPKRGLGDVAQAKIREVASSRGVAFGEAMREFVPGGANSGELSAKASAALGALVTLLDNLREMDSAGSPLDEILDTALEDSGYLPKLRASNNPQDDARVENLSELHSVAEDFSLSEPDSRLADFLERISLVADSDQLPDQAPENQPASQVETSKPEVTLMTVHTAKGLEFNTVFVTGMEDGLFPHNRSLDDPDQLAEERRLAYVAVTRARKRLYLTRSAARTVFGETMYMPASRFLNDIPEDLVDNRREATTMDFYAGLASRGYDDDLDEGFSPSYGSGGRSRGGGSGGWGGRARSGSGGSASGGFGSGGYRSRGYGSSSFGERGYSTARNQDPHDTGAGTFGNSRLERLTTARALDESEASGAGSAKPKKAAKAKAAGDIPVLHVGQKVRHDIYGNGKVLGLEGEGPNTIATVKFTSGSTKRLLLKFAPLNPAD